MIVSEQIDQLASALCAAQAEFAAIPKDGFNPHFKSNFAELADVVQHSLPVATKHGLSVTHLIGHDQQGDTMTTLILHTSGQYLGDVARLHLVRDDPQSQGSATTYMRRYSYMAGLNLVADADDDGNQASASKAKKMSPPPPSGDNTGRGGADSRPRGSAPPAGNSGADLYMKGVRLTARRKGLDEKDLTDLIRQTLNKDAVESPEEANRMMEAMA